MRRMRNWLTVLSLLIFICMPLAADDIFAPVKKGELDSVKTLLEKDPALLNARGESDRTPLLEAVLSRQPAVFEFLLEKGADFNLVNKEGFAPVHFAAFLGETELVKMLIAKGAPLTVNANVIGATPLDLAVSAGRREMVELLIAKGAPLNLKDKKGNTPLIKAVLSGRAEIAGLLIHKGAAVDEKDQMGSTPLLLAALTGQKELAAWLIENKADINAANSLGGTPLSVAVREGHQEVVDLLVAKGASKDFLKQPVLEGDYLGQKIPGLAPERFAPGTVSTEKSELNSVFSADGKEFYFAVQSGPMKWVIMVMKQENGRWSKPLPASFSGQYSDVDLFITPDNKRLFYSSNRPLAENGAAKKDFDIWMVERTTDGWSKPSNPGSPINSAEAEFYPSLTADGTLYFQSQRPDTLGSRDIYRSRPTDGKYEKIENLGAAINSTLFEGDALIAPKEDFLVFSVDRPDSFGQGDLYISFRDANDGWTTPKNMGDKINSEYHENCPMLSPDGKFLFFTRNNDIYWVDALVIKNLQGGQQPL
ncbi:MAG: ankyrin repeat domain-containing protein [Candidatus Aminicenantes bacterium]|nr:ankyrin repeat domain-containing protein [Candidatus Aminicenantes bacterium]